MMYGFRKLIRTFLMIFFWTHNDNIPTLCPANEQEQEEIGVIDRQNFIFDERIEKRGEKLWEKSPSNRRKFQKVEWDVDSFIERMVWMNSKKYYSMPWSKKTLLRIKFLSRVRSFVESEFRVTWNRTEEQFLVPALYNSILYSSSCEILYNQWKEWISAILPGITNCY